MESLKAEPKVRSYVSKSSFVVGPRQLPVEAISKMLMNDDPAEHRHDGNCSWLGGNWQLCGGDGSLESCRNTSTLWVWIFFAKGCILFRKPYGHGSNLLLAKIEGKKIEIRIPDHITFFSNVKIRDIGLFRTEPLGERDTASEFGSVP